MATLKEECGHPSDWNMRLVMNGKVFTYCMGCVVERIGLDNLEAYDNPYIKKIDSTTRLSKPVREKKTKIDEE